LVLPTGTAVSVEEITAICRIIRLAVANAPKVNEHFDKLDREKPPTH